MSPGITFVLHPESSELTTKQAAEVLGASRPFLIRVLEAGQIPMAQRCPDDYRSDAGRVSGGSQSEFASS